MQAELSVASAGGEDQEVFQEGLHPEQNGGDGAAIMAASSPGELGSAMMLGGVVDNTVPLSALYPAPLARHEEVVASKELFLDTLDKFHTALGTKLLMIPKIGGKPLDLHFLYSEVTSRGGSQQVIKDRKWKELTAAFNFPHTTSSAAYVLRKYYMGILHHYEQVYYFGTQGHLVPPPTVDPSLSIGQVVTGAIEGKFEHGYLVSIMMGTEKLRGVLYHLPQGHRGLQHANVPNYAGTFGADSQMPSRKIATVQSSGRKRIKRKKDPNAPRSNRSSYNFFFGEQHLKLKALHPERERELGRMIGDAWNRLTEEEKIPYQDQAVKDKERFQKEMQEYQELLKISDGVVPADSVQPHELDVGKDEKQPEETLEDICDQQLDTMVAKLEETFGTLPLEPHLSSAAVSEHKDSPVHDLPGSPYVTPEQESFDGNEDSEGISDQGVNG
ncbi:unnamed protein product [Sphagnum jensenii]|uniref:Uncharacterized protein n=1 Tax=Sphagnum jensenii TaxID=128206 RepID=A0ABP1A971_9BRYO